MHAEQGDVPCALWSEIADGIDSVRRDVTDSDGLVMNEPLLKVLINGKYANTGHFIRYGARLTCISKENRIHTLETFRMGYVT